MPKTYCLLDEAGERIDAHLSFRKGAILVHSRAGTKGQNVRNADYSIGLELIIGRLQNAEVAIQGAWLDSGTMQTMPLSERALLSHRLLRNTTQTVKQQAAASELSGGAVRPS